MNLEELYYNDLLVKGGFFAMLFLAVPLFVAFRKYRYFDKSLRFLVYFLLIDLLILFLVQLFSWMTLTYESYWSPILQQYGIGSTNIFSILSYINRFLILRCYFVYSFKIFTASQILKFIPFVLLSIVFIDFFFITGIDNMSAFSQSVQTFYVIFFVAIQLWYVYKDTSKVMLNRNPYFWISMGLFFPSLLSVWSSIFANNLYEQDFVLFCQISLVECIIYCTGLFLISVGFYYGRNVKYLDKNNTF